MSGVDTRIGARQEAGNTPYTPTPNVPESEVQDAITNVADQAVTAQAAAVAAQATADAAVSAAAAAQATADAITASAADDEIALKAAVFN